MALHIVLNGDESAEVIAFHQAALDAFTGGVVPAPAADKPAAKPGRGGSKTKADAPPADENKEPEVTSVEIRAVVKERFPSEEDIDAVGDLMEKYKVDAISDFDKKKPAERADFLAELEALADKREAEAAKSKKRRSMD